MFVRVYKNISELIASSRFITMDTVLSLQIMQSESHPSSHNQGPTKASSGSKEGLSVYGLFHPLARSPQGKLALKQLFLRPLLDINRLHDRQDAVAVFSRPENSSVVDIIRAHLGKIKNVRSFLVTLRRGVSSGTGQAGKVAFRIWHGLHEFACHSTEIFNVLRDVAGVEALSVSTVFANRFSLQDVNTVGLRISEVIDLEISKEDLRTVVLPGFDKDLDQKKQLLQGFESLLTHVATELQHTIPAGLPRDLKVNYVPQIGCLVVLPIDEEAGTALFEGSENEDWERMFSSNGLMYYKNDAMRELDERFGDLATDIGDREVEIAHDLAMQILGFEEPLVAASEACAELDTLLALAEGAKRYNLCRPTLTEDNALYIKDGRHPLQELTVPSFVPNDTSLASCHYTNTPSFNGASRSPSSNTSREHDDQSAILLLTGPNFSGKSVYLKQVAIIVYLAQIGSFVPASEATIGITDKILIRLATRDSVSRSQSAFLVDLQQICLALNLATSRSLLIVDEFGKGTTSSDGAGLVAGLLEYLSSLEAHKCPISLVATHAHEIFQSGLVKIGPRMSLAHMEIRLDQSQENAQQQVTYLYNLRPGLSSESFGNVCAAMGGIDQSVVSRAEELAILGSKGEDLVAACAVLSKTEAEDLQEAVCKTPIYSPDHR